MTMANEAQLSAVAQLHSNNSKIMATKTKDALTAVARILSLTPNSHSDTNSHWDEKHRSMTRSVREWVCPGLSLKHGKECATSDPLSSSGHRYCYDRKQAEEHAVNLLSRPLQCPSPEYFAGIGDVISGEQGDHAAQLLQKNIYSSFAVLMDSRLHAYSTVLARHALSLPEEVPNIQEKLAEILLVGTRVEADKVSTQFLPMDDNNDQASLTFQVSMDLTIPSNGRNSSKKTIAVAFDTSGSIHGKFNEDGVLVTVEVQINIKDLLTKMVQQASRVVQKVVETTLLNQDNCASSAVLRRSESFLAMPPPSHIPVRKAEPRHVKFSSSMLSHEDGLDLLSRAAAELPIVSPHLSAAPMPSESCFIPELELEQEHEDDDVSHLSVDQCADIVDTCLFGGDFILEPPYKRTKIEG